MFNFTIPHKRALAITGTLLSLGLFLAALIFPFAKLEIRISQNPFLDAILKALLGDGLQDRTYSLPKACVTLVSSGKLSDVVTGLLVAVLAILAPLLKFFVMLRCLVVQNDLSQKQWLDVSKFLSRVGMTEVFLVAVSLALLSNLPGGSRIVPQVGYVLFLLSSGVSFIASGLMSRMLKSAERDRQPATVTPPANSS